jgi:predicted ATPase
MIQSLQFKNYRVLRDAELPLGPFTLLVGPNGSGKSTVLHALRSLRTLAESNDVGFGAVTSVVNTEGYTSLIVAFSESFEQIESSVRWQRDTITIWDGRPVGITQGRNHDLRTFLHRIRTYTFDEKAIIKPVHLTPQIELNEDGGNLAGVLDRLRDHAPEKFEAYNREVAALAPEFDRVLFDTPQNGFRGFMLRTKVGHHAIPARDLSQGTVLALALLALTHLETPPSMICIEEPDRGIHPRLYREIRDALYRLSYPEQFGLDRPPVQVLITSHSPYMLDLHRDHPEEVVIAEKVGSEGTFSRLADREDLEDLLSEATLGEIWYSGVLGGVPAGT